MNYAQRREGKRGKKQTERSREDYILKLAKDIQGADPELSGPLEVLSGGLLRSGRRTKRLAVELSAANAPFVSQYKLCRYERMAFADRRAAPLGALEVD